MGTMKVGIVGGGLAGLAFALNLAKEKDEFDTDLEITILEKHDFSSRGATFGLAKNGQAAMKVIAPDLLTELQEIGILITSSGGFMLPWFRVRDP